MISVRLQGDTLIVRAHGQLFHTRVTQLRNLPRRSYEDKAWHVPREDLDELISAVGLENIAWLTPQHAIEGRAISMPDPLEDVPIIPDFGEMNIELPEFQRQGASFLIHRGSALLCDEVGTGKTIEAAAAMKYLIDQGEVERVLIVPPNSVALQWQDELESKFNMTDVTTIRGTRAQRQTLWENRGNIVIINYDLLLQDDIQRVYEFNPQIIVVDEAHFIKNPDAQRTQAVRSITADRRWLLTSTPMENKPEDLYELFYYAQPSVFGLKRTFRKRHVITEYVPKLRTRITIGYRDLHLIHQQASPYMLRRRAIEVVEHLPTCRQQNRYIDLTRDQERLHIEIQEHIDRLRTLPADARDPESTREEILGCLQLQTEVCSSVELLRNSSNKRMQARAEQSSTTSHKLEELVELIHDITDAGYQVTVFTRFRPMLGIIARHLPEVSLTYIHGGMNQDRRHESKLAFARGDARVMLTTEAGQTGLNLQSAAVTINYDLPWTPTAYDQRVGRMVRMGNPHDETMVINLIATSSRFRTVDERTYDCIVNKRELIDIVVEGQY